MKLRPINGKVSNNLGLTRVAAKLIDFSSGKTYQSDFLVDTGATDSMAPAIELRKIGIKPIGRMTYELADGDIEEYEFGLAQLSFMNETTAGRVIFGPDGIEPILGVTALESVGLTIDPANQRIKRLPAIPLK